MPSYSVISRVYSLIGPAMVASLIGVLAREPDRVVRYHPANAHPPGLLRVPISVRLVARLGFRKEARMFTRLWQSLYPSRHLRSLPEGLVSQFRLASDSALNTLIYSPYPQLGNKRLVDVVPFGRKEQTITEEAAGRLAAGIGPRHSARASSDWRSTQRNGTTSGTSRTNHYQLLRSP